MNSPRLRALIERLEKCVEEIEKTEVTTVSRHRIDIETIIATVAEFFDLTTSQLRLRCREQMYSWPRHVGLYFARRLTKLSLSAIANHFNYTDHGIVLHAVRRVQNAIDVNDGGARDDIEKLSALLHERLQQSGNPVQKSAQEVAEAS
jgi:chromosomal replication initiator protein